MIRRRGPRSSIARAALLLLLLPTPAWADNCSAFSDCFATQRAALAATVGVGLFAILLSIGLDLSPAGIVKGVVEAFTGRDAVTGEDLAWWERALGVVPVAGAVAGAAVGAARLAGAVDRAGDVADAAWKADRAPNPIEIRFPNAAEGAGKQATRGLTNPFQGQTPQQIHEMFLRKGFKPSGPDPINGKGGYVNPRTGRSYHIDPANRFGEPPHVDVNRPRGYRGKLDKRKYHY